MNNRFLRRASFALLLLTSYILLLTSQACSPEPPLYLYDAQEVESELPIIDLNLDVYWEYETDLGIDYNWRADWYYGWDETDRERFGELGYTMPKVFELRRYYTASTPYAPHTGAISNTVEGRRFVGRYNWGYWDILAWNQITTLDGVQSLIFDEKLSLDSVIAYTNPTMHVSRYQAPRYTHSFYEPEPLFSAYEQAIDINRNLEGFVYDADRKVWIKELHMLLRPITYIYLTQVILHNNKGRITSIDGTASFSGLARSTNLNTGQSGSDAITVHYNTRMKRNIPLVAFGTRTEDVPIGTEYVDIVGGRVMTFGICNLKANDIVRADEVKEPHHHYMDVTMQFNNGMDSTFVFDVTEQVRSRYKGGVITVELNVDTVPIPTRSGGSGFDAVVLPPDSVTHVIEM
ncbi:MAG: hypothetical protein K5896_05640 [Prevotella sp.]|nr:hypothetical protein [Prevotella sp.]